jgi:hypothetical protein
VIMGVVGMLPAVATLRTKTCTRTTRVRTSRWIQQDVCGISWRVWWCRVRNRAEGTLTEARGQEGQQINAAKIDS